MSGDEQRDERPDDDRPRKPDTHSGAGSSPRREGSRADTPKRHGQNPRDGQPRRQGKPSREGTFSREGKPFRDGEPSRDGRPSRGGKFPRDGGRSGDGAPPRHGARSQDGDSRRDARPWQERKPSRNAPSQRAGKGPARGARHDDRPRQAGRDDALKSVRARHDDPELPEEITARDLNPSARNELKTLSKDNADFVARHLAMVSRLIDTDPERAHRHAQTAARRAGRIAIARETLAITAYATGDFSLALREIRTYRRISGRDDQIALLVDSERGVGRPEKALEEGRAVDRATLDPGVRAELAIAMSGARLDLGQTERALQELDIPELDPSRAFPWSPGLFAARAAVLDDLGRTAEAAEWKRRALIAEEALGESAHGGIDDDIIEVIEIEETGDVADLDEKPEDEA